MLQEYLRRLVNLRQGNGNAPHKPILLLSVIQLIEQGTIADNRVLISAELVAAFIDLSRRLGVPLAAEKFAMPFFHLQSGGFWHLHTRPGMELALTSSRSIRSFAHLKEVVAYGYFDPALWALLEAKPARDIIRQALLDKYFPGYQSLPANQQPGLFDEALTQVLTESAVEYRSHIAGAGELELFVRGSLFKREVPKAYNYTCCISGMRLVTPRSVQMIDACHIIPFAASRNDTVKNGLSLCPNLHRAFDRFLLTIDEDYRVRVASDISETGMYGLKQFEGKEILLPQERLHWPERANLEWHWKRFLEW